jgi:hypothetical protein
MKLDEGERLIGVESVDPEPASEGDGDVGDVDATDAGEAGPVTGDEPAAGEPPTTSA